MNKGLSFDQRLWNAWSAAEVERLHGIHQLLAMACHQPEEFATLWDRSDDAAWGFFWGWLKGFKEIWHAQCVNLEIKHLIYDVEMPKLYPEAAGVESGIIGFTEYNELNSGVVEVADDGRSARASYICHGMCYIHFNEDFKRWACFTNERYGSDFRFDEKSRRWKYLHEQVGCDGPHLDDFDLDNVAWDEYVHISSLVPVGKEVSLAEVRVDRNVPPPDDDIKEYEAFSMAAPPPRSGRKTLWYTRSVIQPVQACLCAPKPYATMDDDNTYCPPDIVTDHSIFFKDERDNWVYDVRKRFPYDIK